MKKTFFTEYTKPEITVIDLISDGCLLSSSSEEVLLDDDPMDYGDSGYN